jgi:high-affinity Fe2+/Pb2+ permease
VSLIKTLIVLVAAALVFAPITAYIASSHGRSFWRWFGVGMVLPFVSVFVAVFMAIRSQQAEKRAAEQLPKPPLGVKD